MKTKYEVVSIAGKRRENQDNFYANGIVKKMEERDASLFELSEKNHQLFAVCDGLGGEDAGEKAASIAVENLNNYDAVGFKNKWSAYIEETNRQICNYQTENQIRMGTTFAGLYLTPSQGLAVNVGDSRIYRIRGGKICQLSKDHSEYQTMMEAGMNLDERATRKAKARLTQCLGISDNMFRLEPHVAFIKPIIPGDIYLICSDGLHGILSDEQIVQSVFTDSQEGGVAKKLAKCAKECGSRDNITVLAVLIEENKMFLSKINKIINMLKKI